MCKIPLTIISIFTVIASANTKADDIVSGGLVENINCPIINIATLSEYESSAELCRTHAECELVFLEPCFCPPEVICVCGGGAPPVCEPKKK